MYRAQSRGDACNYIITKGQISGVNMHHEMGTFRIDIEIENPARPGERRIVRSALVDTGAELSWIPSTIMDSLGIRPFKTWRFRQADGTILERSVGLALLHVGGKST